MSTDSTPRRTVECPRCGEPAEQVIFLFGDPASQGAGNKRTFECKNDDCWQATIIRDVSENEVETDG